MFEGLKDMGKLMKQAKEMKEKMKTVQEDLKRVRVLGKAQGDKIQVSMTGEMEVTEIKIDPSLLTPAEQNNLTNGLINAFNQAAKEAKEIATSRLAELSGGLNIPGLDKLGMG